MNKEQEELIDTFFWDVLPKDWEHADRRQTGSGTKTKIGLLAVMQRIVDAGEGDGLKTYPATVNGKTVQVTIPED